MSGLPIHVDAQLLFFSRGRHQSAIHFERDLSEAERRNGARFEIDFDATARRLKADGHGIRLRIDDVKNGRRLALS